jgi:tungstate transport system ATP-binding protein
MKLTIADISKAYGGRAVLRDCFYEFKGQGVYALMGPNGCGKSTLLRICALLENPDNGTVIYSDGDAPLQQDIALKRRVTLVLPKTGVFNTTVFKNAAYGLRIRGMSHGEIEKKVDEILRFVGLEKNKNQHALTLSSGETQRLGIARALVLEPEMLFLDEPTASVDQENTEIIESIIKTMKRDTRTKVVMSTHDKDQADRLADVLLAIKDGTLVERA